MNECKFKTIHTIVQITTLQLQKLDDDGWEFISVVYANAEFIYYFRKRDVK